MTDIYVCVGSACHLKGSYNIINQLQQLIEENQLGDRVEIKAALCLGNCTNAVSVRIGEDGGIIALSNDNVKSFFEKEVLEKIK